MRSNRHHADKFFGTIIPKTKLKCHSEKSNTMNAIEVAQNNLKSPRGTFVTSDGVRLSYIRQGSGRPIVLIHGWSQCAEEFKHQIEPLSVQYDVIAIDQRSHGESQKVSYGLRISRLSKDLHELLTELDLYNVALLGHSMGSSVIWCYIDLFGHERLSKIILVDQPPFVTSDPHWTQQELEDSGAVSTAQQVSDFGAALRSKEAEQLTRHVIDSMVTKHATSEMREWIAQCNLKMPRDLAATLVYNHSHTDWRDLIPGSTFPPSSSAVEQVRCRGNRKNGFIVKSKVHSSKYSKNLKVASTLCSSKTRRNLIGWSWNI